MQNNYACQMCEREIKFDSIVSHSEWARISPTGDEGGLLCASCMVDGLGYASARITNAHATTGMPMKRLHKHSSSFVIMVTISGRETHLQISGIGKYEFEKRAGSLQKGMIRAKGGEAVERMDATHFDWGSVKAAFDVLVNNAETFPAFEAMAIVRVR